MDITERTPGATAIDTFRRPVETRPGYPKSDLTETGCLLGGRGLWLLKNDIVLHNGELALTFLA